MQDLKEKLEALQKQLVDRDNEILVLADETGDNNILNHVAYSLAVASNQINSALNHVKGKITTAETLSSDDLNSIAELATAFDSSDDEELRKKASVLDQLLLNIGVTNTEHIVSKKAQEEEVAKIRERMRAENIEKNYKNPSKELERDIKAAEATKQIKEQIKEYRPLETSLSTRYCPDHAGTSVVRIADYTFQCPLDKKIYSYTEGFTTMKGNKVPGTSVENQTQSLSDRELEKMHFSTRESQLND